MKKVNEAHSVHHSCSSVPVWYQVAVISDQEAFSLIREGDQGEQTASKSCITSVTSGRQNIKGFTDSYELICQRFVTHSF